MITAIIGHGRSPEGRGWAARIDSCGCVVRMWDWHWQPSDYGRRYDYGVLEIHWTVLKRFNRYNRCTPAMGWIASDIRLLAERGTPYTGEPIVRRRRPGQHMPLTPDPSCKLPSRTQVIDQRIWTDRHKDAIGGVGETGRWELTRGGIAACWAVSRSAPGDTVVLVGCDNLYMGVTLPVDKAFSAAYRNDYSEPKFSDYRERVAKTGNHDFPAERRLVELLAGLQGVTVLFAQEAW